MMRYIACRKSSATLWSWDNAPLERVLGLQGRAILSIHLVEKLVELGDHLLIDRDDLEPMLVIRSSNI